MNKLSKYLLGFTSIIVFSLASWAELSALEVELQKQQACDSAKVGFADFKQVLSQRNYGFWNWYVTAGHRRGTKKPGNFSLINEVEFVCDVVHNRDNQSEFNEPIWKYIERKTTDFRRDLGFYIVGETKTAPNNTVRNVYKNLSLDDIKNISKNNSSLAGVKWSYAMAIWSMESDFGANMGSYPLLDSLVTQAYLDLPSGGAKDRRFLASPSSQVYRKYYNKLHNVFDALWIYERLWEVDSSLPTNDTTLIKGSWAGAFGHTQFMPTTYRDHYDNSLGLLRTWLPEEPLEGLALTHKFFAKRNSSQDELWGVQVEIESGKEKNVFDRKYSSKCASGTHTLGSWEAIGVKVLQRDQDELDRIAQRNDVVACLNAPMGVSGLLFLTFPNYNIFKAYNAADTYALSGALLAEKFQGRDRILSWPKNLRKLSKDEVKDLQRLLGQPGNIIDGIAGSGTQKEIYKLQRACQRRSGGAHRNTSVISKFLRLCRSQGAKPKLQDNGKDRDFISEVKMSVADGYPTEELLFALILSETTQSRAQRKFDKRGLGHFDRMEIQEYLGFQGSDVDGLFGKATRDVFEDELERIKLVDPSVDTDAFKDSNGNPNRAFLVYSRKN